MKGITSCGWRIIGFKTTLMMMMMMMMMAMMMMRM